MQQLSLWTGEFNNGRLQRRKAYVRVSGFKFVSLASLSIWYHHENDGQDPGKCQERYFQLREGTSAGCFGAGTWSGISVQHFLQYPRNFSSYVPDAEKSCRDDQRSDVTRGVWNSCVGYVRKTSKMGNVIAAAMLLESWGALECGCYQLGDS